MLIAVLSVVLIVIGTAVTVVLVSNHRADVAAEERSESAAAKAASESAASAASVASEASVEARESEEAAAELAAAQEAHDSCTRNVGPLYNALSDVDARLDVGLSLTELSDMLGEASIAYNRIDIDELGDGNCLSAAAKMESAFIAYNATVTRWNDCIFDDYYCELDDIDPELQIKWLRASRLLNTAEKLMDEMDPSSPTYVEGAAGSLVA